jgi:hypothetical protein
MIKVIPLIILTLTVSLVIPAWLSMICRRNIGSNLCFICDFQAAILTSAITIGINQFLLTSNAIGGEHLTTYVYTFNSYKIFSCFEKCSTYHLVSTYFHCQYHHHRGVDWNHYLELNPDFLVDDIYSI